jgi:hypothetical protein
MKCRKNVRKLIQEYTAATPANKPNTPLAKFRAAVLAMKAAPTKLTGVHAQANRYDDYVYVHRESMADDPAHPMPAGPHAGHRGPSFFPWHREFLRQFEFDLRAVSGDNSICLPYWDFTADQAPANPGYPFFDDFLGGDGVGPNRVVQTGAFAKANGWVLAINNGPGDALQRNFGAALPPRADVITALAATTYDAPPWNRTTAAGDSFRNQVEGWPNGPKIHNQVHAWVGGSMLQNTSPNDPVFFLNHAKEDELWAVWMQKHPAPHYLPSDSEPPPGPHTHLRRLSDHMDSLAEYFGAGAKDRAIDLLDHKAITWYDTDLPDIVLESGPAVAFNNTPAGTTVAKNIRFRIQTCRRVTFSLTGLPTGDFSVVGGPDFFVTPVEANDFEYVEIEVRFTAVGANVQVSAVDIEARITDEEGYYAANPNDAFTVEKFHIELVANNIVTTGPAAQGDDMQPGEVLNPGQSISSANGQYTFVYQGDGNLVLYQNRDGQPLWASNTDGRPTGVCIIQGDGNLVIYDPNVNPIWSSNTGQHPGSRLVVQDDGNVVIYRPDGTPVWATNTWLPLGPAAQGDDMQPGEVLNPDQSITSANGRYRFIYQGDGNLVLYDGGTPLWASGTNGRPVGVCIMQGDGNLVIYVRVGQPIWSSNTGQHPGSRLVVQDDGNVVIYRPDGTPVWATNTVQP